MFAPRRLARRAPSGIPLVPADQHADAAVARVEVGEAEIAGREIKFLVVERVVGDVHLAVDAEQRAVGVEDRGGVVIEAGGAALEQRGDDRPRQFARPACPALRSTGRESARRDRTVVIFLAAKILRAKQLLEADDLRAARGGFANAAHGRGEIFRGIERAFSLESPMVNFSRHVCDTTIRCSARVQRASADYVGARARGECAAGRRRTSPGVRRPVCVFCWLG